MKLAVGKRRLLTAALAVTLALWAAGRAEAQVGEVIVEVDQRYEYRTPLDSSYGPLDGIDLPLFDAVDDILFAIGGTVIDAKDAGDAVPRIVVALKGRALGRRYIERNNDYLYTGVSLNGSVELVDADGTAYRREFASLTPMPFQLGTVNLGGETPHDAPFAETLDKFNGLTRALAEVMIEAWGAETILPALADAQPTARADIASCLGNAGDPVAVPALIEALELDDSELVRQKAAWSLGRLDAVRAIPVLIAALDDGSGDVRWFAAWSLRNITGEEFGPDHDVWADWWAEHEGGLEG
jgi:hypothetical protein